MVDHSNRTYRGNDGYRHQETRASSSGNGDPLSELARLIGGQQNDPFAAPSRNAQGNPADWRPSADPFEHHDPRVAAANTDYPEPFPPSAEPAYAARQAQPDPRGYGQPSYDAPQRSFAPPPFPPQGQGYDSDPYYSDHDEYEETGPARRRGGMLTVMAVLALGLIGTAGAFGYRAVFGNSGSSAPPVIKADSTPAKIVPAAPSGDKQSYDRVGDRSQPERVVSREEKPVDVNDSLKAAPRVVGVPSAIAPTAPQIPASASALVSPNSAGAAPTGGPKKIRTVTIRSDDAAPEAPVARSAPVPTVNIPPAAERAQARVASASTDVLSPPPARVVTTRQPVQQATDPNAPLSLAPPPSGGAARAPSMRTASAPAAPAPGPAPARTSMSDGSPGAYTVQVTSQRSEAEAQAAFRSLQAKFPAQLGNQLGNIRRADLGDKGVYYRVQVGPFASADQASELCSSLKSAGGQCVVQKN